MSADNPVTELLTIISNLFELKEEAVNKVDEKVRAILKDFDENYASGEIIVEPDRFRWIFNRIDNSGEKTRYVVITVEILEHVSKKGKVIQSPSLRLWTGAKPDAGLRLAKLLHDASKWPVTYEVGLLKKREAKKLIEGKSNYSLGFRETRTLITTVYIGTSKKHWWEFQR